MAITSDTEHFEAEYGLDAEKMYNEFGVAGVYRNEDSPDAGILHLPERVIEEHGLDDNNGIEEEEETEQVGLTDF